MKSRWTREAETLKLKKKRNYLLSDKEKQTKIERHKNRLKKRNRTASQNIIAKLIKCHEQDMNSSRYWSWRRRVFKRDSHTCQKCGRSGESLTLEAHHIIPWFDYPEGRFKLSNGETLCSDCHTLEHPWRVSKTELTEVIKRLCSHRPKEQNSFKLKIILRKAERHEETDIATSQ